MPVADGSFSWRWLAIFRRLNHCESAGDGLALNRLALARNGCGLQAYARAGERCGSTEVAPDQSNRPLSIRQLMNEKEISGPVAVWIPV